MSGEEAVREDGGEGALLESATSAQPPLQASDQTGADVTGQTVSRFHDFWDGEMKEDLRLNLPESGAPKRALQFWQLQVTGSIIFDLCFAH